LATETATSLRKTSLNSVHRAAGAKIVIMNAEPTPFDDIAHAVFRDSISDILPRLLQA